MNVDRVREHIHPSWHEYILPEFEKPYMTQLREFLAEEIQSGLTFFPPADKTFRALEMPLENVRTVILGQDPYHGRGQAMGLSFSVPDGVRVPPSLQRIFKELHDDVGIDIPNTGDLTPWTDEILLLNTALTVRAGDAGSHSKKGWETFTDHVISTVNEHGGREYGVAFLLMGNPAKAKKPLITDSRHLIVETAHPSPLARSGFLGTHPFSQIDQFFVNQGAEPISWSLTEKK